MGQPATLDDFIALLGRELPEDYRRAAERSTDDITREFMLGMFSHQTYQDRKTELLTRLVGIKTRRGRSECSRPRRPASTSMRR